MRVFEVRNVNEAFHRVIGTAREECVERPSRNGPVWEYPETVSTVYSHPTERVLFNEARNHNSIFAWAETLWMLAGRDDLAFLTPMNARMAEYSDDGKNIRGSAYGKRWRSWFGNDQLDLAIERLRANLNDRRVVIQHWDASTDNVISSKDVPCNLLILPYARPSDESKSGYELDLTVMCRSNDMIYGAYGSNAVHFSILQELIASAIGIDVGTYTQISNSLHLYTEFDISKKVLAEVHVDKYFQNRGSDYQIHGVNPHPLIASDESYEEFMGDVGTFFKKFDSSEPVGRKDFATTWFREVWSPIWNSYQIWITERNMPSGPEKVFETLSKCRASDLKLDVSRWYQRRIKPSFG